MKIFFCWKIKLNIQPWCYWVKFSCMLWNLLIMLVAIEILYIFLSIYLTWNIIYYLMRVERNFSIQVRVNFIEILIIRIIKLSHNPSRLHNGASWAISWKKISLRRNEMFTRPLSIWFDHKSEYAWLEKLDLFLSFTKKSSKCK